MKRPILLFPIVALLGACGTNPVEFSVDVGERDVESVELKLYNRTEAMRRDGNRFFADAVIDRDGSGRIVVSYTGGGTVNCEIGYVSYGMDDDWAFVIEDGDCRLTAGPGVE